MLLRAGRAGLCVTETPTDYRPRVGESKLNTFGDGWRHIQMLLLLSPHLALIVPGVMMAFVGLLVCLLGVVIPSGLPVAGMKWPPIYLGPMLFILGAQAASSAPSQHIAHHSLQQQSDHDCRFLTLQTPSIVC